MRFKIVVLYKITNALHNKWVKLLWNSQKKGLKFIGKGSNVLDLPFIYGSRYISIGDNFSAGKDVRIEAWDKYGSQVFNPKIIIGSNVSFTDRCYLSCIDCVEIGDGVLLGRDVFIADNSHGDLTPEILSYPPVKRPLTSKGPVSIGKNVWIGRQATVLSGVSIGDNAVIGANSVVNRNVPANCLAAGNPVKVIKFFNE